MPFADAAGARLHYESTGAGTPIVFVHETAADQRSWEGQVRWFSRMHRCITFNARGFSPSETGPHPEQNDWRRFSEDIGCVMDAAGVDRAFVVGLSVGAYCTAQFAIAHPGRVLGIVLAGLGTGSDDPPAFQAATLALAASIRSEGAKAMARQLAYAGNRVQLHNKDRRGWLEWLHELNGLDPAGLANALEFFHSRRPPVYAFEAQLRELRVPALIAVGDEDAGCLGPALFLKRTLPMAGLWVSARTGHAINLEEPAQFNAAVQSFIQAVQCGVWGERDPRSLGGGTFAAAEDQLPE